MADASDLTAADTRAGLQAACDEALAHLAGGGLLAIPTETVWGLAADARSEAALASLRIWKGRDAGQPISVLVPDAEGAATLGHPLGPLGQALAARYWPGPVTLVLPRSEAAPGPGFARGIRREDGALGLRCTPHPGLAALVEAAWRRGLGPLTATSLNRSGDPPARDRREAARLCGSAPGEPRLPERELGDAHGGVPSAVVDLSRPTPRLIRPGILDGAALAALAARVREDPEARAPAPSSEPATGDARDAEVGDDADAPGSPSQELDRR